MTSTTSLDRDDVLRLMREFLGKFGPPKFDVYRHATYSGHGLVVAAGASIPETLDAADWVFLIKSPTTYQKAEDYIARQGYHLFENDLAVTLDVPPLSTREH